MPSARSEQIDLDATPYYHVMNRCVRRSRLCGFDESTQTDYSHRKEWIVSRLKYLADVFAIKICAFAIMGNHYHVVLHVQEQTAQAWSDAEIIRRWSAIFKNNAEENKDNKYKIIQWRERLSSISWFMRCLNEKIARNVNEEDDCTGRFWEGRFKSQALLDKGALLSAMVYVDLNPIRAGLAQTPESSEFTSIYERIQYLNQQVKNPAWQVKNTVTQKSYDDLPQSQSLVSFSSSLDASAHTIDLMLSEYLELVDYTGRIIRDDKKSAAIPGHLASIISRLQFDPNRWVSFIQNLEGKFASAVGCEILMLNFAKNKSGGLKGIRQAKKSYSKTKAA